jgi:cytochrome c553
VIRAKYSQPRREAPRGRALARCRPCRRLFHALSLLILGALAAATAVADEAVAHRPVNVAMCRGCHGIADYRSAYPQVYSVPRLGGQQAAYIAKALHEYKSGSRTHATMRGIAATLSEAQIMALAAYYSDQAR